jgi:hypothetical protein
MTTRELEMALAAADPVDRERLDRLDFGPMEVDLVADLAAEPTPVPEFAPEPSRRREARLALALGTALAVVIAVVVLVGSGSGGSSRAYGAELVRFAESTPLLLLEGPDWRVQNVTEYKTREGVEGTMEFVTGKSIPYESIKVHQDNSESGMAPPSVRQRQVELAWHQGSLKKWLALAHPIPRPAGVPAAQWHSGHPHGEHWILLPVLGTTAHVNTKAEAFTNQGGPGNRQMLALWSEDGHVLELRAAVADQAAFEERLGWLTKVDAQTWLGAMPAKVVKAADFEGTVREMLRGIPLPKTFAISRVPDEGLTTNTEALGSKVAGTVSCLWFRQWGAARRSGDKPAELQAERAMATSRHWKILRDVESTNGYSPLVWELAAAMPKGYWVWHEHRRDLLAHAEGLGCARIGLPLLPEKMKLQRERGVPPPPD